MSKDFSDSLRVPLGVTSVMEMLTGFNAFVVNSLE